MLPCLSPEQMADLLDGEIAPSDFEGSEVHIGECDRCREEFLRRTEIADATEWQQAACELLPMSEPDRALLNEFKTMSPVGANGDLENAANLFDVLFDKALNGEAHRPAPVEARHRKLPDIPGFEILGELGRGGMGVVYKARQIAHDRTVALKMILSGLQASAEDLGRFHDEAEAISRLRHPHIVQIFDVGQVDDRLFFVLEFIEGGTLADKIRGRALPSRSAAQLMETLARAMHYAHERGIVHRDLKPANVMLHGRKAFMDIPEDADRLPEEWDFRRFMPKITDFGLAKLLDRNTGDGHTASGDVVGTPSYMAPEQARGGSSAIGPPTDVYSLGALLYEMLTGRPPFQGATPMDTLFQVHTQEPIPPRKIVREIPGNLEAVCLKCLRKRPEQRYASAEAMADDLRLFLDGQPIQTRGLRSRWYGVQALRRTANSWGVAALVLVLAIAAGAGMVTMWLRGESRRELADSRGEAAALARQENARLRLAAAQSDCEQGDVARGTLNMAALLADAGSGADMQELRDALRLNLAAWAPTLPRLRWISPDSAMVATLGRSGREIWYAGHDGLLMRSAFSTPVNASLADSINTKTLVVAQDGSSIAAAVGDSLRWWDLPTGEIRLKIPDLGNPRGLELSSDGAGLLFAADEAGKPSLRLLTWDPATRKSKMESIGSQPAAWAWRPNSNEVLVVSLDGSLEMMKLLSTREDLNAGKIAGTVTCVSWIPDGSTAALGCNDGVVRLFNHPETKLPETPPLRAHVPGPVLVAAGRGGFLLTAGADRMAKLWRLKTGELVAVLPHAAAIAQISFPKDGDVFLTRDVQGTVRVWDVPPSSDSVTIPWSGSGRRTVELSPNGRMLVSNLTGSNPRATLIRFDGLPLAKSNVLTTEMTARVAAFHPSGDFLIASEERIARVDRTELLSGRSSADLRQLWTQSINRADGVITALSASPDGGVLLTGTDRGMITTWDAASGKRLGLSASLSGQVLAAAFRADGQAILVGGADAGNGGEARVWSLAKTGEPLSAPLRHPEPVVAVQWEAAGEIVRTTDAKHVVRRWHYATGERVDPGSQIAPDALVTAFDPTADHAVLAGIDGVPRLVSSSAGQLKPIALSAPTEFRAATFSRDGRLLLTGWGDGVRLFDGRLGSPIGPHISTPDLENVEIAGDGKTAVAWGSGGARVWALTQVELDDAVAGRRWLRHCTGIDRADDGAIRFLDGREWKSTDDVVPKKGTATSPPRS